MPQRKKSKQGMAAYEVEHRVEIHDVSPLRVELGYLIERFVEFRLDVALRSPLLGMFSSTQGVPPAASSPAQEAATIVSGPD
jgi:hypothetical protein|eukprot:COSAG02_NODE_5055_length_4686_cov_9.954654_4_plen_82_part_00